MKLNELQDQVGATKERKRVGRGIASGTGKTSGRGQKGQKARTGVSINGMEGGQMPLYRRLPKRGFTNIFRTRYAEVNLGQLQVAIDAKKLDTKKAITAQSLVEAGVVRRAPNGIKLLGKGEIKTKVTLEVAAASKSAQAAVEKAGGKVTILAKPQAEAKGASAKKAKAEKPE